MANAPPRPSSSAAGGEAARELMGEWPFRARLHRPRVAGLHASSCASSGAAPTAAAWSSVGRGRPWSPPTAGHVTARETEGRIALVQAAASSPGDPACVPPPGRAARRRPPEGAASRHASGLRDSGRARRAAAAAAAPRRGAHAKREDKDSLTVGPRTAVRRLGCRGEDKDSPTFLIFPRSTTPPRRVRRLRRPREVRGRGVDLGGVV